MKFKACPFCGGTKIKYLKDDFVKRKGWEGGTQPLILCEGCGMGMMTGYFGSGMKQRHIRQISMEHWNMRNPCIKVKK